jgi:riboflavin biosynthesis pyrimidine reductase
VFLYTNFVASLDGRIAVSDATAGELAVPDATANARDWRLFLELAAPADACIVSGRFVRERARGIEQAWPPFEGRVPDDLMDFRAELVLPPQPALVVVSRSLELPPEGLLGGSGRRVIVATTEDADRGKVAALEDLGVEVVRAGRAAVDGQSMAEALRIKGLSLVYSVAGPEVMHTLLRAGVLHRLYLTTVFRALAGDYYATLVRGVRFDPPVDFRLAALYLDAEGPRGVQQLLQVYEHLDPG